MTICRRDIEKYLIHNSTPGYQDTEGLAEPYTLFSHCRPVAGKYFNEKDKPLQRSFSIPRIRKVNIVCATKVATTKKKRTAAVVVTRAKKQKIKTLTQNQLIILVTVLMLKSAAGDFLFVLEISRFARYFWVVISSSCDRWPKIGLFLIDGVV